MNITALLPMKGHSERVPNKNMRLFSGKPLYHQVAGLLQNCYKISRIIIDTDSEIIAEDAKRNFSKVHIVERPIEIRGDMIPMNSVIAYDLSQTEGEHFLQTHSTNPLLTLATLEKAIDTYFKLIPAYDSLFSVTRLQTRLYWSNGAPVNHDPKILLRTQDLTPLFEENSNLYFFSRSSFYASENKRIGLKPYMFEINKLEAMDIDEEHDFTLAEFIHRQKQLSTP